MKGRVQSGRRWASAAVCCVALASSSSFGARDAVAQGFGLNEIGSCAIARGFAATSMPCDDASTIYWNPAATTTLRGLSVYAGASAISVKGAFTQDTIGRRYPGDVPTEYPPFVGVNWTPATHRYALGVATYVPYGLTSQWGQDFPGRFSAQRASLKSFYVQPNVAFELVPGKLSLGGGPTIGWSQLELRQSIDLAPNTAQTIGTTRISFAQLGVAPGTEFARARVKGSTTAVGFNVGAQWTPAPDVHVGARYLSKVKFTYDGADATFTQVNTGLQIYPGSPLRAALPSGTPANVIVPLDQVLQTQFVSGGLLQPGQQASTQLEFPAQFQIGIGYSGIANTKLSLDYALIDWSSFQALPVNFGATSPLTRTLIEDYKNSNSVRVGLDHTFGANAMSGLLEGVSGRLGFAYAQTPAPDVTVTPLLPDMNRYNFTGGLGIPLGRSLALDATYLRVETEGRRGRIGDRTAAQTAAQVNTGFYSLNANIFSLSLKAQF